MAEHKHKNKSTEALEKLGEKLVRDIKKGDNPVIDLPVRALSNVKYSEKTKTLTLGEKMAKRYFFNVAHAKKFMQTVEVASISKNLLEEGKHASLRDVFYMAKRTIPGTKVNVVDEQSESLSPDEQVLVRIDGTMKFMTGHELLDYAQDHGKKIFDDGKKERYANLDLKVCAFDANHTIGELPATLLIKHPPNNLKKIVTASGKSVKVTGSHSVFVSLDGFPVEAKVDDLKAGDWIAIPRKINVTIPTKMEIDIVKKLSLSPENILRLLVLKGDKKVLSEIIRSIDREELRKFAKKYYHSSLSCVLGNWRRSAIPLRLVRELDLDLSEYYPHLKITCRGAKHGYRCKISCDKDLGLVIGLLLSEGAHAEAKRKGERTVSISNTQKEFLETFRDSFLKCFGDRPAGQVRLSSDGTYRLNLGYDLLSYIIEYGLEYCVCRAWDKHLPSFLFDADEETVKSFIRWFRLGDGSVHNRLKQIRFHTSSRSLVNGLTFLLLRLGILSRIYEYGPRKPAQHTRYEVRVGNREYVRQLAEVTSDFSNVCLDKKSSMSSDVIVGVGKLFRKNLDGIKLDEGAYKKFDWYNWEKRGTVCRGTLQGAVTLLEKYGEVDSGLKSVLRYDLAWDQIIKIEDAGIAPYTIDLAVPQVQNFIGGNGLLLLHNSDDVIEDLELVTDLSREQLHVNANKNGSVAGTVVIEDKGDTIDWSKLGSGGWSIPSNVEEIKFKKVDAKYILYMEKAAVWERLHEDRFWAKQKCIIMSSQGQTTRGIRRLLQRMYEEFKLPIYVLTDMDSWGHYIYSVIKYGSINLAHISEKMAIPSVRFLGIRIKDIEKYGLSKHLIKLNENDLKRLKQISEYDWFKNNNEWQHEFEGLRKFGAKAEIQALSSRGISFISDKYLPEKIRDQDFLE